MRKARRRLLRWRRYADKICNLQRLSWEQRKRQRRPAGLAHAIKAVDRLTRDRQLFVLRCMGCGLLDSHHGDGDGIGSCDCPRCYVCDGEPGGCGCHEDFDDGCGNPVCHGDCDTCYADDNDDGTEWPPDVVTEHAFAERGLL